MYTRSWLPFVLVWIALGLPGCIKNDLPYPYQKADILEIEVEGQLAPASIDTEHRTVRIRVCDTVDVQALKVLRLAFPGEASLQLDAEAVNHPEEFPDFSFWIDTLPETVDSRMNFEQPVELVLHTYQDHKWTISVTQVFERSVLVKGQVGKAAIYPDTRDVIIYVSQEQALDSLEVYKMQLGGSIGVMTPLPDTIRDYRQPRVFTVSRLGKYVEEWRVVVMYSTGMSTAGTVNAWAHKAIIQGGAQQGVRPVVEYKTEAGAAWAQVPAEAVKEQENGFEATLQGLEEDTDYVWRVVLNGVAGSVNSFRTEKIEAVANLGFDDWSQHDQCWYPSTTKTNDYWATGNEGVTSSLAGSRAPNTVPDEVSIKGRAARMETLGGMPLVGVAAGNLFVGTYKTDGLNPANSVKMGRTFTGARPNSLRGWYKYVSKPVDVPGQPAELQHDMCHIYMWVKDEQGQQIAYGELADDRVMRSFERFDIELIYSDSLAKPASMAIVATSSRYGGDFKGSKVVGAVGIGSVLWVDEFELVYD